MTLATSKLYGNDELHLPKIIKDEAEDRAGNSGEKTAGSGWRVLIITWWPVRAEGGSAADHKHIL